MGLLATTPSPVATQSSRAGPSCSPPTTPMALALHTAPFSYAFHLTSTERGVGVDCLCENPACGPTEEPRRLTSIVIVIRGLPCSSRPSPTTLGMTVKLSTDYTLLVSQPGPKEAIPITSSLVVADLPRHQLTIVDAVCPFVSSAWLGSEEC